MPIEECPMFHARRDGKLVRVENDMFICRDGKHLPVAYTASPFTTEDGIKGCVVLFEDITARQAAAHRVERDLESWRGSSASRRRSPRSASFSTASRSSSCGRARSRNENY
jgi:hypothetical protein